MKWMWMAALVAAGCAHEETGATYSSNYSANQYQPPATAAGMVVSMEVVPDNTIMIEERQPVAGGTQAMAFEVRDSNGQTWRVNDPAVIQRLQMKLVEHDCDPGRTDGKLDSRFSDAVRQCQQKMSLPQTGRIDQQTSQALGFDLSSVRPTKVPEQP